MYTELVYMYNPIYNIINTYVIPDNDFLIPWKERESESESEREREIEGFRTR